MTESEGTIPTQGDSESVNGAVRPDEVILGEGGSSAQMRSLIRDVALFFPTCSSFSVACSKTHAYPGGRRSWSGD